MSTCLGLWSSLILAHELLFAKSKAARLVKAKDFMLCTLALCTKDLAGNQAARVLLPQFFYWGLILLVEVRLNLGVFSCFVLDIWSRYIRLGSGWSITCT